MMKKSPIQGAGFAPDRLNAFTDGVIAIIITILVLGIDIPEDHRFSEQGLIAFLLRISKDVILYAVSFWLIAAFWVQHHVVFHFFRLCNRTLLWLNIVFLFVLTLIPFLTKMRGLYPDDAFVVLLFGVPFLLSSMMLLGIWRYAVGHPELHRRPISPTVAKSMNRRILIGSVLTVAATGVSLVNYHAGALVFIIMPFFYVSHRMIDAVWVKGSEGTDE